MRIQRRIETVPGVLCEIIDWSTTDARGVYEVVTGCVRYRHVYSTLSTRDNRAPTCLWCVAARGGATARASST